MVCALLLILQFSSIRRVKPLYEVYTSIFPGHFGRKLATFNSPHGIRRAHKHDFSFEQDQRPLWHIRARISPRSHSNTMVSWVIQYIDFLASYLYCTPRPFLQRTMPCNMMMSSSSSRYRQAATAVVDVIGLEVLVVLIDIILFHDYYREL